MGRDPKNTRNKAAGRPPSTVVGNRASSISQPGLEKSATSPNTGHDRPGAAHAHAATLYRASLHELMEQIAGVEDDGYYKVVPGNGGKSWYLSYKWTSGRWRGHYVMAVVGRGDLPLGYVLLAEKVYQVRAGTRQPSLDNYERDR